MIEEIEAMRHFKDEYETSKHYGSDLIIELDDAKTLLNLIQKQDTEINKLNNVIAKIKNKLEEHIKHCEQEAKGSLNNEICNISLKFDKGLLEIISEERRGEYE